MVSVSAVALVAAIGLIVALVVPRLSGDRHRRDVRAVDVMPPTITAGDRTYHLTSTHEQKGCQGLGTGTLVPVLDKVECGTVAFGRYRADNGTSEASAVIMRIDDLDQFNSVSGTTNDGDAYFKVLLADGSLGPLGQDEPSQNAFLDRYMVYVVADSGKNTAADPSDSGSIVQDVQTGLIDGNQLDPGSPSKPAPGRPEIQATPAGPVTVSGEGAMASTIKVDDRTYRLTASHEQQGCQGLGTGALAPALDGVRCQTVFFGRYASSVPGWEASAVIVRLEDDKQLESLSKVDDDGSGGLKVLLADGSVGPGDQEETGGSSQFSLFDRYLVYVMADPATERSAIRSPPGWRPRSTPAWSTRAVPSRSSGDARPDRLRAARRWAPHARSLRISESLSFLMYAVAREERPSGGSRI